MALCVDFLGVNALNRVNFKDLQNWLAKFLGKTKNLTIDLDKPVHTSCSTGLRQAWARDPEAAATQGKGREATENRVEQRPGPQ